ncbi:penicillin-binding transpeptidase domain-containing protein [Flexivirga meconopsidis]|uniref:penicillin-binding transpeptidase domain-containing protein n=1 Tax=Flexivirga meconopsidis TaxID=2977121 RepID=UPI00223FAA91|nr:penicillin-binding transpeptidase domain-containing protein [Flexivirga meconopsidis]
MSSRTVLGVTGGALVVAAGVGGYMFWQQGQEVSKADDAARAAVTAFARDWSARTLDQATYVGTSPQAAAANFATATGALGNGPIAVNVAKFNRDGDNATATLRVDWSLGQGRTFSWDDPVQLVKQNGTWGVQVSANSSLWHPKLQADDSFAVNTAPGSRGEIKGAEGSDVMTNQPVYDLSIDPVKATEGSVTQLQNATDIPGLVTKLQAAKKSGSKAPIPVVTYRGDDYVVVQNAVEDLTGIIVEQRQQPLAPTRTWGQPMLGSVGPATADMLKKNPGKYRPGQIVGLSGLQAQYDQTLGATPGFTITPHSDTSQVLYGTPAKSGSTVATTLDPRVQTAAEKALAGQKGKPAAIVALDVKSGNVLAAANSPSYGIERAMSGHYAPGSTMKIASAYALLSKGFDPNTIVPCPKNVVVDGYQIGNFEGETAGKPKFSEDFAKSCNTAFVNATKGFSDTDLQKAANALGFGVDWSKQVGFAGAYAGNVPVANGPTDKAVSVFGQGRVLASPLSVAVMAGSVARGSMIPPALVTTPAQDGSRTPKPLDAKAIGELRSMMRLTVTDGTATELKKTPGGDVYAKTGTSEFSEGGKSGAHAWLAGWQGNVAFCVLVEDVPSGKSGGTVAAPVAKDFLTTLDAS